MVRDLSNWIMRDKVDILHCHGARANFVSTFIRKNVDIPVITTVHSDYTLDFAHHLYKNLVFTKLNRYSLKHMDYYLAVTEVFKDILRVQGFDISRAYTVYNGIPVREMPDNGPEETVFGCVTRLVPIKGTHILLEAVKICVDKGYQPKVRIAGTGEGPYVDELHGYVKDHGLDDLVEFVGYITDIDKFYETISINILPSETETFPYALLEGGIRAKGTIASNAGGIVEMIDDKVSGLLFDVGDSAQLAGHMMTLMEDKERANRYGLAFRKHIIEKFSDISMARRHKDVYEKIVARYRQ